MVGKYVWELRYDQMNMFAKKTLSARTNLVPIVVQNYR
jgi:hypothetical protein